MCVRRGSLIGEVYIHCALCSVVYVTCWWRMRIRINARMRGEMRGERRGEEMR